MASQRWHVLGAGALGSLWIARLARAASGRRTRPTLILKDETWSKLGRPSTCSVTVDERHRGGVARNSHSWLAETSVQPLSAEDPIERLLVTTKAPDVRSAIYGVVDRLAPEAIVVILCNGMGAYEELLANSRLAGLSYMLAATTNGAFTTARFQCVHAGLGDTWIGMPPGSAIALEDAQATVASLQQTGLHVTLEGNIDQILWEKLAVNASINGLTALMSCRNGAVLDSVHGLSLMKSLCAEVGHVVEASKIPLRTDLLSAATRVAHQNADNFSSMHQDMVSGRATEIDYINGFVVKKSALLGVPTPTNLAIYDLIKMKEEMRT